MTIEEAIREAEELTPDQIDRAVKIGWLGKLDGQIFRDIISTHERDEGTPDSFTPYDQYTDQDTALLAPAPHDEMYLFYLEMKAELTNKEYEKYNNSAVLFNQAYMKYAREYHRNHRTAEKGTHHRF